MLHWTKADSHFFPHTLINITNNFSTTLDKISTYNFWIQDYPSYKNSQVSQVAEWLNDILNTFHAYSSIV